MSTPPDDDLGRYLTTLPGWREFVATATGEAMAMLTQAECDSLSKEEKYDYDEDRLNHHAVCRSLPPPPSGTPSPAGAD